MPIFHLHTQLVIKVNILLILQLTLMVDSGRELGISIRGGAEHGLGIYISQVEEGSVGEAHGLKVNEDC